MRAMKMAIEKRLKGRGQLVCANEGVGMLPLQRQHRDLMMIERKPCHRLKKYDVPFFKRENGQYVLHRILGWTLMAAFS